jgi:hypothetical protein
MLSRNQAPMPSAAVVVRHSRDFDVCGSRFRRLSASTTAPAACRPRVSGHHAADCWRRRSPNRVGREESDV